MSENSARTSIRESFRLVRLIYRPSYLLLIVFLLGATLTFGGSLIPAYTDVTAAGRILIGSECEIGVPNPKSEESPPCESAVWHRSMDALRTYKWRFVDLGAGLMVSALTLIVFAKWCVRESWRTLRTPRRSASILVLVAVAWLALIPSSAMSLYTELSRDYYPRWADSIAIPIFEIGTGVLVLFLPCLALWSIFVLGARLPAPIFLTVPGRHFVNIGWTVAAGILLFLPIIFGLAVTIIDGPVLMVPFLWLIFWLALCARAAALSRHMPKAELSKT